MHYSITRLLNRHRTSLSTNLLLLSVWCLGCGGPAPLTVDMPLHLEEHLDAATIVGSEVPEETRWPFRNCIVEGCTGSLLFFRGARTPGSSQFS